MNSTMTQTAGTVIKTRKGVFVSVSGDHRGIPAKMLPIPGSLVVSVHANVNESFAEATRLNAIRRVTVKGASK